MKKNKLSIIVMVGAFVVCIFICFGIFFIPKYFRKPNPQPQLQASENSNVSLIEKLNFIPPEKECNKGVKVLGDQTKISWKVISKVQPIMPPIDQMDGDFYQKYAQEYGVDEGLLKKIAWCESKYSPGAVNGPYGGLYQFTSSTWQTTRNLMCLDPNPDLRFNPEEAIRTAAYKISHGGLKSWPVCGLDL